MSTETLQLPAIVSSFFEEVTKVHAPEAKIVKKQDSFLMKLIGFILKPVNSRFMESYITTIGTTIYVPDRFFLSSEEDRSLAVLAHETQHIIDYKKNPVLFILGYLFPQNLALLSLLSVFAFLNPFMLLFLLSLFFLAPIPAPFRYYLELKGYRISILFGRVVHHYTPSEMQQTRDWIKNEMTSGNYYYTWPFPGMIERNLQDESFILEPRYKEVLDFLKKHNRIH